MAKVAAGIEEIAWCTDTTFALANRHRNQRRRVCGIVVPPIMVNKSLTDRLRPMAVKYCLLERNAQMVELALLEARGSALDHH